MPFGICDSRSFLSLCAQESQTVDSSVDIYSETNENKLPLTNLDGGSNVGQVETVNNPWVFVRMVVVLLIIVGLIYLIFKVLKKKPEIAAKDNDPFLRKVSSVNLSAGKSVQVVTLMDHAYILGVGNDSITYIDEVKDKELINAMNLYADRNQQNDRPKNFSEILEIFMPKKHKENESKNNIDNTYAGSAEQIIESLKKQKERLNQEDADE